MRPSLFRKLYRAIHYDDTERLRCILVENPNALQELGRTNSTRLLQLAENETQIRIFKTLVEYGANDVSPDYTLKAAIIKGDVESATSLLKNGVAKIEGPEGKRFLLYVFNTNNVDTLRDMLTVLCEYGLDVCYKNGLAQNVLHQLMFSCNDDEASVRMTEIFMSFGVSIRDPDISNMTPLIYSIQHGKTCLISYFFDNVVNVNENDESGNYPLLFAADECEKDIVELLLSKGANVNLQDSDGLTALHHACMNQDDQVIDLLLRRGAEISVEDKEHDTPYRLLQRAEDINFEECMKVMVREFAKLSWDQSPAVKDSDLRLIKRNPRSLKYFLTCLDELEKMSETKFFGSHSYYSISKMSMSLTRLSKLMKNEELLTKFRTDLPKFTLYGMKLQEILDAALLVRDRTIAVETRLQWAFNNVFPDVVLRQLARNFTVEDLPI